MGRLTGPLVAFRKVRASAVFWQRTSSSTIWRTVDVRYFVHKFGILRSEGSCVTLIPMLIAGRFSPDAMRTLKAAGILCPTVSSLFGNDIFDALIKLLRTLKNCSRSCRDVAGSNLYSLQQIGILSGCARPNAWSDVRADRRARCRRNEAGMMEIGKYMQDPNSGDGAEVDVFHLHGNDVACYECKGYGPQHLVTLDELSVGRKRAFHLCANGWPRTLHLQNVGSRSPSGRAALSNRWPYRIFRPDGAIHTNSM